MGSRPTPLLSTAGGGGAARRKLTRSAARAVTFPLALTEGRSVEMPAVLQLRNAAGGEEVAVDTVLVFDAIEFDPGEGGRFDVAINVPPELAGGVGQRCGEYAGSFATLPRGGDAGGETVVVALALPLDEVLAGIGIGDGDVSVVIVPPRIEIRKR